jgi:hypothetical protein
VLQIEFVKAIDGKPASEVLALPPPGKPQLPAIVDVKPKLPATTNGSGVAVPFLYPRAK